MIQEIIVQICAVIAYGALCTAILIIFVMPVLTYIMNSFIVKSEKKEEREMAYLSAGV